MRIIPIVLGLALVVYSAISLAQLNGVKPAEMSIEELEKGNIPPGEYVRISGGRPVYAFSAYSYPLNDSNKINTLCYPVVSEDSYLAMYGDLSPHGLELERVPVDQRIYKVVVKTSKYSRLTDVPLDTRTLVVVGAARRGKGGIEDVILKELRDISPRANLDDVILVTEDEKPGVTLRIFGIVGGAILMILGVVWIIKARSQAADFERWRSRMESAPYAQPVQPQYYQPPQATPPAQQPPQQPPQQDWRPLGEEEGERKDSLDD
jgi:hypothetical protein